MALFWLCLISVVVESLVKNGIWLEPKNGKCGQSIKSMSLRAQIMFLGQCLRRLYCGGVRDPVIPLPNDS